LIGKRQSLKENKMTTYTATAYNSNGRTGTRTISAKTVRGAKTIASNWASADTTVIIIESKIEAWRKQDGKWYMI